MFCMEEIYFRDYAVTGIYVVLLRLLLYPLVRRGARRAGWVKATLYCHQEL